ncbi:hypothetical protein [Fructilactobacillus sanfranciscensis]|uniref:hypothetical protein n=1 Tax=Fructilactobacillus sanfranciscensis TaxID=1625 RepID=UPI0031FA331A
MGVVQSWIKIFDLHGIDGLELSGKVGRPLMKKHKKNDKVVPLTDSERNKYINEIINLKSKLYNTEMENDIIKKRIALEMKKDIFPKHHK